MLAWIQSHIPHEDFFWGSLFTGKREIAAALVTSWSKHCSTNVGLLGGIQMRKDMKGHSWK